MGAVMVDAHQHAGLFSGLLVAAAGYLTADHASVLVGALAGSMWTLLSMPTQSRKAGALLLVKLILTACTLTGPIAYAVDATRSVPAAHTLCLIAFFITVIGERWMPVFDVFAKGFVTLAQALVDKAVKLINPPRSDE